MGGACRDLTGGSGRGVGDGGAHGGLMPDRSVSIASPTGGGFRWSRAPLVLQGQAPPLVSAPVLPGDAGDVGLLGVPVYAGRHTLRAANRG